MAAQLVERFAILLEHGSMVDLYGVGRKDAARMRLAEWRRKQRKPGSPLAKAIGLVEFK